MASNPGSCPEFNANNSNEVLMAIAHSLGEAYGIPVCRMHTSQNLRVCRAPLTSEHITCDGDIVCLYEQNRWLVGEVALVEDDGVLCARVLVGYRSAKVPLADPGALDRIRSVLFEQYTKWVSESLSDA